MQNFLPYPDFKETAKCLDWRRLGNQRNETNTIIKGGWPNHPAAKMWVGFHDSLKLYFNTIVEEWVNRGYMNFMPLYEVPDKVELPWWLGDERLHSSHRAALLYKLPEHYNKFGWKEEPSLNYWWPV